MSAVVDVLNGAADLIERDGWCQGHYCDGMGRRCADGALAAQVHCHQVTRQQARMVLRNTIGGSLHVIDWNDAPGRTQAEVVAALRAAAERAA